MHLGPLCMQLRVPVCFSSLWEGQKLGFFPKDRTYRAFLHNKRFFSDSPGEFALLLGQCAALRSLAQLTTPFLASGNAPKWVFFPKDRTYRAFFVLLHKRNFFRMVPEGLNAFWTFVHAAESAS